MLQCMDAGKKYIHVSGCVQGDFLMIEIENSYQGKGEFKKGTGLSNVKTVSENYSGAMDVEARGNICTSCTDDHPTAKEIIAASYSRKTMWGSLSIWNRRKIKMNKKKKMKIWEEHLC